MYIGCRGAGQKEALTYCGRQSSTEGIPEGQKVTKPWRYWPGTVALHEIHQFQKSTNLLICKLPFSCLVCKITLEVEQYDMHFQVHAILTLQEAAEAYLVGFLEDTNLCAIHANALPLCPRIYN